MQFHRWMACTPRNYDKKAIFPAVNYIVNEWRMASPLGRHSSFTAEAIEEWHRCRHRWRCSQQFAASNLFRGSFSIFSELSLRVAFVTIICCMRTMPDLSWMSRKSIALDPRNRSSLSIYGFRKFSSFHFQLWCCFISFSNRQKFVPSYTSSYRNRLCFFCFFQTLLSHVSAVQWSAFSGCCICIGYNSFAGHSVLFGASISINVLLLFILINYFTRGLPFVM